MNSTCCFDMLLVWTGLNSKLSYRRDSSRRQSLRCSRSFKVTDLGTNRKVVWHFLLVNNSNLHLISRRFKLSCSIGRIFAFDRGESVGVRPPFNKLVLVISANIAISQCILTSRFFRLHFVTDNVAITLIGLTKLAPKCTEYGELMQLTAITPFKVI